MSTMNNSTSQGNAVLRRLAEPSQRLAFGEKLRERRERLGLTQTEFAELIGTNQKRMSEIERGMRTPVLRLFARIIENIPELLQEGISPCNADSVVESPTAMQQQVDKPAKLYKPWTPKDDRLLKKLVKEGILSKSEVSEHLGRSYWSIIKRASVLGLYFARSPRNASADKKTQPVLMGLTAEIEPEEETDMIELPATAPDIITLAALKQARQAIEDETARAAPEIERLKTTLTLIVESLKRHKGSPKIEAATLHCDEALYWIGEYEHDER